MDVTVTQMGDDDDRHSGKTWRAASSCAIDGARNGRDRYSNVCDDPHPLALLLPSVRLCRTVLTMRLAAPCSPSYDHIENQPRFQPFLEHFLQHFSPRYFSARACELY